MKQCMLIALNFFENNHIFTDWHHLKITDAVPRDYTYSGQWFHPLLSLNFTGTDIRAFILPPGAAAAAVTKAIPGWGSALSRRENKADEGPQSGPGTLCSSLAPPALDTTRGNPPADAPWEVGSVKKRFQCTFTKMKEARPHRIIKVAGALTSHSSQHRQDAGRYTADRRCPSSCRPVSSSSRQRHRVLKPQRLWGKTYIFCCIQIKPNVGNFWPHLWSQSCTPWAQRSYRQPRGGTLKLQAQSEPQRAPSSCGPPHFCSLIYTSGGSYDCNRRWGWRRHATRRSGRRWHPSGNNSVVICGWQTEGNLVSWNCFGHSGEHLDVLQRAWTSRDKNNDTSSAVTKRGWAGEGMELSNMNQHFKFLCGSVNKSGRNWSCMCKTYV